MKEKEEEEEEEEKPERAGMKKNIHFTTLKDELYQKKDYTYNDGLVNNSENQ